MVSLARGKLHTFTVFLVTVREGNTAEYKPCDTYTGVTGDKVVEINCHGEIGFLEQFSAYWPISFTFPSLPRQLTIVVQVSKDSLCLSEMIETLMNISECAR